MYFCKNWINNFLKELNISNTNDFFNSIQAETDKRTKKIKEIEEKQKDINDSIEKSDRKLRILKGIDNDINQAVGSKNREQIKSDIANLNTEIKACNKEIKKYEEQLQKCIEYNQKLGKEQTGYDLKKSKINDISEKIMKVKKDIGDKLDILEDIENSIKAKNVVETDFMGWKIIVRKNDLTEERTDAIVNPANEALIYEGGLTKAVADKGGDVSIYN